MAQLEQDQIDRLLSSFIGGLMSVAEPKMVRASVMKISESDEVWEAWGKFITQMLAEAETAPERKPLIEDPPLEDLARSLLGMPQKPEPVKPMADASNLHHSNPVGGAIVNPEQPLAVNRRPA